MLDVNKRFGLGLDIVWRRGEMRGKEEKRRMSGCYVCSSRVDRQYETRGVIFGQRDRCIRGLNSPAC